MKLRKFAQSTFMLTNNAGKRLLVDPGKYNLDPGRLTAETFPTAEIIVITHKHADHFEPQILKSVLQRSSPLIITNPEIKGILEKENIKSDVIAENSMMAKEGYSITAIRSDHVYKGETVMNFGIVVEADNVSLYYTSDTRFMEPSLLPAKTRAKYLLVPINDRGVSMGIDDASVFSRELNPELVIPVHYDSPQDKDRVDPKEFAEKATRLGLKVRVLGFGEEMQLE